MAQFRRCMLLMVNVATGLISVSGITLKYVCPGDSIQAFENIEFDRCNGRVSLHISGNRSTEIAKWLMQNCTIQETCLDAFKDRVLLDQNGTITIHNLHHFDQGKYFVISNNYTLPSIQEVQLNVMVAPKKECKPMIDRLGKKLHATLKNDYCGVPVVTLYWKGYAGVSDTNGPLLQITPATESRTYYACIQGPALLCVKSHMELDNCSPFVIEENNSQTVPSESSNTVVLMVVIIVVVTLLILGIVSVVILFLKRRRRRRLKRKLKEGLLNATLREKTHFDTQRSPSNDQHQPLGTRSESDYEMNEVGTDLQFGIDPATIRELQELRDAARCKICFANKTSVVFMPCKHVATCDECSIPLHSCPVCRETIKERKRICFDSNE
ncbi:hypothetical protein ACJMK2_025646 [Sinanodonta woodiana]|uniref:RING-type domain-containing protein n=1 Tax=Sinanodonta woodiana TaxID=1069815 RepID=A0ABD3XKW0_SINWO